MPDLKETFKRKEWKGCCGKGCKKCKLAQAYIDAYGKSKGLKRLNEDRTDMRSGKARKKAGKKAGKRSA
jgi:hypothetical protein